MNILSLNSCGLVSKKRNVIKEFCNRYKTNFLGLQETHLTTVDFFKVRGVWGNYQFQFTSSSANSCSGGLLSIWDPAFYLSRVWSYDNVLIVQGEWVFLKLKCFLVNVYAPQED